MKKLLSPFVIIILALGYFSFFDSANAMTEVTGNISSDTIWTSANSPYQITDTLQVHNGATLTIENGVEVKVATNVIIKIAGTLMVNGTSLNPVIFSSLGSDKWGGIEFIDSANSQINNSIIENANRAVDLQGISEVLIVGNIFKNNAWVITDTNGYQRMYFVNNTAYDNSEVFYGIRTMGDDNLFNNNIFRNNSSVFDSGYYFGITKIENNNFIDNGLVIKSPAQGYGYGTVNMGNNWWGTTNNSDVGDSIIDKNDDLTLQTLDYSPIKTSEINNIGSSIVYNVNCVSWTYSDWSSCSINGQQTRNIITSSPNSCVGGNPILTQACEYTPPTCTSWTYSNWGSCNTSGIQTRSIISELPSNCVGGNPIISQSCQNNTGQNNSNATNVNQESETNNISNESSQTTEEQTNSSNNITFESKSISDEVVKEEKSLITKIDNNLSSRLQGNILLQVEKNGEGWYLYPDNKKKYYLGRPADAFNIMRNLGLGIKHSELTNYLNSKFPSRLSGKILLDVEQNGEAYYINPKDLKGYFLNRPADAFKAMHELGLGITNSDIRKIDVGEIN